MLDLKKNHTAAYVDGTDFVVLTVQEYEQWVRKSEHKPNPQYLNGPDGAPSHAVLSTDEFDSLYCGYPDRNAIFTLSMPQKGVYAEAILSFDPLEPWIVVFAGATLGEVTPSLRRDKPQYVELRNKLIRDGIVIKEDNGLVLTSRKEFAKYSVAACVISGTSQSGNELWKNHQGKTLNELGIGISKRKYY